MVLSIDRTRGVYNSDARVGGVVGEELKIARLLQSGAIFVRAWRDDVLGERSERFTSAYAAVCGAAIRSPSGCRQSESWKMRMLPPAVLTYSTFPAAIQL